MSNVKPPPPSWSSIPHKTQLAVICSIRIVDFFQQAALQAYMFYQLASFNPEANESDLSFQVGVLQGVFTAAQIFTSILWGRIADHPSWGRKRVIMISLIGQGLSCVGLAFSSTFAVAVVWRLLGGAINATVGGARTALSECTEKRYHSRTFLLLPLAWNIANIIGPPVGGLLSDPVKYHPTWFGENSPFGGKDGVGWMKKYPYATPNLFSALLLFADAALVFLVLRETLPTRQGKRDVGRELIQDIRYYFDRVIFDRFGYARVGQIESLAVGEDINDTITEDMTQFGTPLTEIDPKGQTIAPMTTPTSSRNKPQLTRIQTPPFREVLTRDVIMILLTVAIFDFQLSGFTSLWTIFLSTDPRPTTSPISLPFTFTGGLGFTPSTIGLAMSILGIVGITFQLTLYPRINARLGLLRCTIFSLFVYPFAYLIAPYLALLVKWPVLVWLGILLVASLLISARTFSVPGVVLLTNNATPRQELLGTVHGMGAATSSAFRTLGPIVAGHWYSKGLEHGRVGEGWWGIALVAVLGCIPVWWVRDGG